MLTSLLLLVASANHDCNAIKNASPSLTLNAGDTITCNAPVTLNKDINLVGSGAHPTVQIAGTSAGGEPVGLSILLDGHKLTISNVKFTYQAKVGLKVRGNSSFSGNSFSPILANAHAKPGSDVLIQDTIIEAPSNVSDCAPVAPEARNYFGVILHQAAEVRVDGLEVTGPYDGHARLQSGLALTGSPTASASAPLYDARISDSNFFVQCGQSLNSVGRRTNLSDVNVGDKYPCEWRPAPLENHATQP